jgi:lactate dehydrogenase-like 2-hydroxyacid dehydrogenase
MKFKRWEGLKFVGEELAGKKLGIIGLGSMEKEVAKKARALGMEVSYLKNKRCYLEKELGVGIQTFRRAIKRI